MLETYLRRVFVGTTLCVLGGAIAGGLACSSSPRKIPGTTGAAGSTTGSGSGAAGMATGAAGSTGAAGAATGAAGDTSGAAGQTTGAAGATGAAGDTSGAAGSTTGVGGTTGAAGQTTGAAGSTTGAAGAAPTDNGLKINDPFPVAVTKYWYPSGWDGDPGTVAAFGATPAPIKIEMMTGATTGPCSKRVAGAVGDCFKITYTPVAMDGGASGHASVALIPNIPGSATPNFGDATMAPHVPQGATTITAEVAGDKGGETVSFNLWDAFQTEVFSPTLTADQAWQKLSVTIPQPYDQELSPFGWGSASTTPIVFYYDDVRINNN
jgi:hypothetical protein